MTEDLFDDYTPNPLSGETQLQQGINLQRVIQQPYDDVTDVPCK